MMTPMVLRLGEMLGVGGLGFDAICTPPFAKSFVDVEPGGEGGFKDGHDYFTRDCAALPT